MNRDGSLVVGSAAVGRLVEPNIQVPEGTEAVSITAEGVVNVVVDGVASQAGTLQLATFINPEGLLKLGENLYAETEASGSPQVGDPGQNGTGILRSGMLEASNVNPVRELIDLITTQRSFELNSQAIQVGDEVLQLAANLRRY